MGNKIIVPFDDKKGGTYELNIDIDRLSKGEISNAIVGIGRTSQQPTFVSKINKAKKLGDKEVVPFPGREVRENKMNYGKGFDYVYGTKPVSDQEDKNPFASALKKIKPSAEKLSWFNSAIVESKNVSELHKVIDKVLASGARLNACNDGEWSFAAVVLKAQTDKICQTIKKLFILYFLNIISHGSASAVIAEIDNGALSARVKAWFWVERSNHWWSLIMTTPRSIEQSESVKPGRNSSI